jgi:hypothetical protein
LLNQQAAPAWLNRNATIPHEVQDEVAGLIGKVATQGERWGILEHCKGAFCKASGKISSVSPGARRSNEYSNGLALFTDTFSLRKAAGFGMDLISMQACLSDPRRRDFSATSFAATFHTC